jgi:hypothetical protein
MGFLSFFYAIHSQRAQVYSFQSRLCNAYQFRTSNRTDIGFSFMNSNSGFNDEAVYSSWVAKIIA